MDIRDYRSGIPGIHNHQLDLKWGCKFTNNQKGNRTYVEDLKDPVQVPLPARNLVLIAAGVDESRDYIPSTLLDDPILNLDHGSAIMSR
jgi:hypothetical protein